MGGSTVAKPDDFPPTADIVAANAVKGPGVVVADVGGKSFLFRSKALYGDQDAEGKYLYLKVTDTDGNEMPITGWKSCPVPYLLDESSGVFQMFGALGYYTDPVGKTGFMPFTDPWFGEGPTNVCQRIAINGHTHPSCVVEEAADRLYTVLPLGEVWQRNRLGMATFTADDFSEVYAWPNSEDRYCDVTFLQRDISCQNDPTGADCVYCPAHFGIAGTNAFGTLPSNMGSLMTVRPHDLNAQDNYFEMGRSIETLIHEYFHMLQRSAGMYPIGVKESTARAPADLDHHRHRHAPAKHTRGARLHPGSGHPRTPGNHRPHRR